MMAVHGALHLAARHPANKAAVSGYVINPKGYAINPLKTPALPDILKEKAGDDL